MGQPHPAQGTRLPVVIIMRFLHTSDLHYGLAPDPGCAWSAERAGDPGRILKAIVDACRTRHTEALFICGNLFDSMPSLRQCEEVNTLFASIPDTKVLVIPGSRDPVGIASPVRTFPWAENVEYSRESSLVYSNGEIRVLLSCGEMPSASEAAGYTYLAMGGRSKAELGKDRHYAWPGSPLALSPQDTGVHGCCELWIDEVLNEVTELELRELPAPRYVNLTVHVTPDSTAGELVSNLRYEMLRRGKENIYTLRIRGVRDPLQDLSLPELQSEFRILRISDESEPRYDLQALYAQHSGDMIGFYIREMNREDMSPVQKKALYYGIDALLRTSEERKGT